MIRDRSVVPEQRVVVVRQVPNGCRDVGVGQHGVLNVEQLPATLVAADPQRRPEPLERLPQAREAGPRRGVRDGRRPERAQVAQDRLVGRGVGGEAAPRPGIERGQGDLPAATPQAARRRLDRGQAVADRVGQRGRVEIGPATGDRRAELGHRPGPRVDQLPPKARTGPRSTPAMPGPHVRFANSSRSSTGWTTGRSRAASAAVTRWIVDRISTVRTASCRSSRPESVRGSKLARRA